MKTATQQLHDHIRRSIESGNHNYAEEHGHDWFNLTPEEAAVFQLSLDELPSLVALWESYEAVCDICNPMDIPEFILAGVRTENPWLHANEQLRLIGFEDFENFGKLFGFPFRSCHAWYFKYEFWQIRAGIVTYKDEREAAKIERDHVTSRKAALPPHDLDDDIPF